MKEVILKSQPVKLYKFLKFEGLVPSGDVAKLAFDSGDVVNGEIERRKRKIIVDGATIEFNGETIRISVSQN